MGKDHWIAGVVEGTHDSRYHAAIEGADHLGVTGSCLPEWAVGGEENLGIGVCAQLESDSVHYFDQRGQDLFVPRIVGGADRGGEFLAVLPPDLLGDSGDTIRLDPIKHPYQELDQEVVTPAGME
jgi:hypothetical protein